MVLTAAVLAALGLALARRWDEVRPLLGQVSPAALVGAFAYCLLGLVASMLAWRALLGDLGSPLPVRPATRVLFLGQLAKYLPGSTVWAVLAQTELAHDYGVPRKRAASAGIVLNLVTLGVGLLVALLALPELLSDSAPRWLHWSPLLVPVGLACLTPAGAHLDLQPGVPGAAPAAAGSPVLLDRGRHRRAQPARHLARVRPADHPARLEPRRRPGRPAAAGDRRVRGRLVRRVPRRRRADRRRHPGGRAHPRPGRAAAGRYGRGA